MTSLCRGWRATRVLRPNYGFRARGLCQGRRDANEHGSVHQLARDLLKWGGGSFRTDKSPKKSSAWSDVVIHARGLESGHILSAPLDGNDRPAINGGRHHGIHQKTSHAPISIHVGVDVNEHEVSEDDPDGRFGLRPQKLEELGHQFPHRLVAGWNVHRTADVDGGVP